MASQLSETVPLTRAEARLSDPARGSEIRVQGLTKSFGAQTVLRGLDVTIGTGEFVAVIGKSGCGKSTLLRLLAGLDLPTGGFVSVDGKPLTGLNRAARVMFQDARLLPWERVARNVGLGLGREWRPAAQAALREVGLEDRAEDWPGILSGGQRQRVALARALASRPRLMLLDEPLGALDALTRLEMQALLERVWLERGLTAFLITHDVEEAVTLADRVLLIEQGRLALDLKIGLPRPRDRAAPEFIALRETALDRVLNR